MRYISLADKPEVGITIMQQPEASTYEDFMNTGHSAAWDKDWDRAIRAYSLAIRARPDAPSAYNSLGLALLQVRPPRLEEALRVYQRAHELDPDDPLPLEKSADVYERMGRLQDAARQYLAVAEAYLARHDLEKAIGNWERATRVTPGLVRIHQKLALAYERIGNRRQAVREYMVLAANFQRNDKVDIAIQAVERALRLEPRNPQALNMLQALRAGGNLVFPDDRGRQDEARRRAAKADDDDFMDPGERPDIGVANAKGPIGEAVDVALETLALAVSEGDLMNPSTIGAIQAIEYHQVEAFREAIIAYQQAESGGMRNPALFMALGSLLLERQRWKEAMSYLERAAEDEKFKGGAYHGLGIAHRELNNIKRATTYLIRSMQLVDVGLAVNEAEAGQLGVVYDRLLQTTANADDATLIALNDRFFDLLTGPDWKQRVELTRHQLEDATDKAGSLLDVAAVSPEIVESMNLIDQYINSRRFNLAMEEAYHVIEKEPDYLAVHLRVGSILVHMNQLDSAMIKYRQIGETYLARDNPLRAREVLQEAIRMAPMDVGLRQDLIEMLEQDEEWDEILDQYVQLGITYMDLGDASNARMTFNQAVQIGQRVGADTARIVDILYRLADLEMSRVELRPAMRAYENIRSIEPTNEKARTMLIDLNYRLGDPVGAMREMDRLLQIYAQQRNGRAILELLDGWIKQRPSDEALRTRLAAVYQQINRPDMALKEYHSILELQLNQRKHAEACQTIKRILSLRPSNAEKYMSLAQQLGCG